MTQIVDQYEMTRVQIRTKCVAIAGAISPTKLQPSQAASSCHILRNTVVLPGNVSWDIVLLATPMQICPSENARARLSLNEA